MFYLLHLHVTIILCPSNPCNNLNLWPSPSSFLASFFSITPFCAFTLTHNNHNYATFLFLCSCVHKTITLPLYLMHNNHNYATFLFLCSCVHKTITYSYTCSQIYKIWFRVFYVPTFYLCVNLCSYVHVTIILPYSLKST